MPGHRIGGPFDDAFSAFVGQPVSLVRTDRDGDGADVFPLTVISLASVAELGRRGGYEGALDPLRFRINIELDGCEPFEEDTWDGRRVRVGEAVVRIAGQIPRCVVTTQDPRTGLRDWNTLKQIAAFRAPLPDRARHPVRGLCHRRDARRCRRRDRGCAARYLSSRRGDAEFSSADPG